MSLIISMSRLSFLSYFSSSSSTSSSTSSSGLLNFETIFIYTSILLEISWNRNCLHKQNIKELINQLQSTLDKWNLHGTEKNGSTYRMFRLSELLDKWNFYETEKKVPLIELLSYLKSQETKEFLKCDCWYSFYVFITW